MTFSPQLIHAVDGWWEKTAQEYQEMRDKFRNDVLSKITEDPDFANMNHQTVKRVLAAKLAQHISDLLEALGSGEGIEMETKVMDSNGNIIDAPPDMEAPPSKEDICRSMLFMHASMLVAGLFGADEDQKERQSEVSDLNDLFAMPDSEGNVTAPPNIDDLDPFSKIREALTKEEPGSSSSPEVDYIEVVDPEIVLTDGEIVQGMTVSTSDGKFGRVKRVDQNGNRYVVAIPGELEVRYCTRNEIEPG